MTEALLEMEKQNTLARQSLQYYPLFLYFKTEQEPLFCFWLFGICLAYCLFCCAGDWTAQSLAYTK